MTRKLNSVLFNELFVYQDGNLYWKKNLNFRQKKGQLVGWLKNDGYRLVTSKLFGTFYVHKIIWTMHGGTYDTVVDHIDNDKSNNKIENLRAATQQQNVFNTRMRKDNKSGVKGVCWFAPKNQWLVQVRKNKKSVVQKFFDDFELAELVAIEGRDKFHGRFANHG